MLRDIGTSIKAYWEAWKIIVDKKLWLYLFIPGFISLFYGIFVGFSAWYWSDNVKDLVLTVLPMDSDSKIISKITTGLINVGIATTGVVIYKYVILVILSPILSSLSRRIEESVTGYSISYKDESNETAINDFTRSVTFGLRQFIKEIGFTVVILIFGLLPLAGYLVTPLIFLVQCMYIGFCAMDFSLNRYFSISGSSDFARKNLGLCLGIGIIFMLIVMIPVFGLFFAPSLSTAAATLKTVPRVYRPTFA